MKYFLILFTLLSLASCIESKTPNLKSPCVYNGDPREGVFFASDFNNDPCVIRPVNLHHWQKALATN